MFFSVVDWALYVFGRYSTTEPYSQSCFFVVVLSLKNGFCYVTKVDLELAVYVAWT